MATLKEIAAKSGVCTATVSYVLNNRPGVRISEATRKRVLDAATELDYRPNALARSVRSGRSETIAFLYRDSNTSLYLDKVFRGIYSEATAAGFAVKNYFAGGELNDDIIRMLLEQRIAGVVIAASDIAKIRNITSELIKHQIPIITVNCDRHDLRCPSFLPDDLMGGRIGTERLIRAGCRRIVLVSCSGWDTPFDWIRNRIAGYVQALHELKPEAEPVVINDKELVGDRGKNIFLGPDRPDGCFCISDEQAMRLQQIAYHCGIAMPEELSIIGYGDHPAAALAVVPLTTVSEPLCEIGARATRKLIRVINHMEVADDQITVLPVSLLERDSVKRND